MRERLQPAYAALLGAVSVLAGALAWPVGLLALYSTTIVHLFVGAVVGLSLLGLICGGLAVRERCSDADVAGMVLSAISLLVSAGAIARTLL